MSSPHIYLKNIYMSEKYFFPPLLWCLMKNREKKIVSLWTIQINKTIAWQIIYSPLHLILPPKDEMKRKKSLWSLRRTTFHPKYLKMLYHKPTLNHRWQIWEVDWIKHPRIGQETPSGSTITICLNKFSLEENLSYKSCQENTTIIDEAQLTKISGKSVFSTRWSRTEELMRSTWAW